MATHPTWSEWFANHPSNDTGNRNLKAFSNTLSSGKTEVTKLQQVTEEINTVILAANKSNGIMMLFPKGLWRNKDKTRKQTSLHAGDGPSGSKCSRQFEFGTCKL